MPKPDEVFRKKEVNYFFQNVKRDSETKDKLWCFPLKKKLNKDEGCV